MKTLTFLIGITALAPTSALALSYNLTGFGELFAGSGNYGFSGGDATLAATTIEEGNGAAEFISSEIIYNPGGLNSIQTTLLRGEGSISGVTTAYSELSFVAEGVEVDPEFNGFASSSQFSQFMKFGYGLTYSLNSNNNSWAGVGFQLEAIDPVTGDVFDTLIRNDNGDIFGPLRNGAEVNGAIWVFCGGKLSRQAADFKSLEVLFDSALPGPVTLQGSIRGIAGVADCTDPDDPFLIVPPFEGANANVKPFFDLDPIANVPVPSAGLLVLSGIAFLLAFKRRGYPRFWRSS